MTGFLWGSGGLWEASVLALAAGKHPAGSACWQERGAQSLPPLWHACASCTMASLTFRSVYRDPCQLPCLFSARVPYRRPAYIAQSASKGKSEPARELWTDTNIWCLWKFYHSPPRACSIGLKHWVRNIAQRVASAGKRRSGPCWPTVTSALLPSLMIIAPYAEGKTSLLYATFQLGCSAQVRKASGKANSQGGAFYKHILHIKLTHFMAMDILFPRCKNLEQGIKYPYED